MRLNILKIIENTSSRKIVLVNLILIGIFLFNNIILIEKFQSIIGFLLNICLVLIVMSGLLIMICNLLISPELKEKAFNINS